MLAAENKTEIYSNQEIKNKRILIISAIFPPDIKGGAERSASSIAQWMSRQGAQVGVITTAKQRSEVCSGAMVDGLKTWRVWMPRDVSEYYFSSKAPWWKRKLWHLQNLFDPRNRAIVARVLDEFKPDIVNIHLLQGIGYNILAEIGKRGIPTIYFLHLLDLACYRQTMFRDGHECETQCGICKVTSAYKLHCIKKLPYLGFCSPSRGSLEKLAKVFPIKQWENTAIFNANRYPAPTVARTPSDRFQILYVGRLDTPKGIHVLIEAAAALAQKYSFTLTIIGSGPQEAELHQRYGQLPWCRFTGFLPEQEISNYMINSDVLCVPSLWAEVLGGIIVHALSQGLPVLASDKGGIPDLVVHRKNGLLLPAGDKEAWSAALCEVMDNPLLLQSWREYARADAHRFDPDFLAGQIADFILRVSRQKIGAAV